MGTAPFMDENVLDGEAEEIGNSESQFQGRAVPSGFDGTDGLAGDPDEPGEFLLPETAFLPQLFDAVFQKFILSGK